jgi:hypothetical protein
MNNLPVGLIGANALELAHIAAPMKNAFLIGVDLGPNLSVTGSLPGRRRVGARLRLADSKTRCSQLLRLWSSSQIDSRSDLVSPFA